MRPKTKMERRPLGLAVRQVTVQWSGMARSQSAVGWEVSGRWEVEKQI